MTALVAPTASLQAQEPAELTSFPSILHRFMELPLEIRLLIYNELITQHVDLYRPKCGFCPERARDYEPNSALFKSTNCANLAHTQILRTSKQVYSETLPILYSKNKVHMTCLDCERTGFILVGLWDFLVKPHDSPIEPIGHYHRHVKSIAVMYGIRLRRPPRKIRKFSSCCPTMEHQILAHYENTKHISLQTPLYKVVDITLGLVRRSYQPTTERVYNYKTVLAEHSADILEYRNGRISLAALEEMCDAIILSHAQGHLKDTVFVVQSIRLKVLHRDTKEVTLYLGCDKYCASNTAIEQILAGPVFEDKRRPFEVKALMDLAGVPDV